MQVPQDPKKVHQPSFVTAAQYLNYKKKSRELPACPQSMLLIQPQWSLRNWTGLEKCEPLPVPFCEVRKVSEDVAVGTGLGVGGPNAAMVIEELAAWGVKRFLWLGIAGSLLPQHSPGKTLTLEKALRDEGTSFHYLEASRFAFPDHEMTQSLAERLSSELGTAWTTDAPYRETKSEIEAYASEGIGLVEMEAASVFAVSQALGLKVGFSVVVSDTLTGEQWSPQFHTKPVKSSLIKCIDSMVELLQGMN